jgi:8-oxo-dGTP pyrophosphatase MutT (NUDIX family)
MPRLAEPSTPVRADVISDKVDLDAIAARLLSRPPTLSDIGEPDWTPPAPFDRPPVPAAVLIGLVERPEGLSVLYTRRSADLRAHSGQVAFPGGKVDPTDADAADAALREAHEEVGLERGETEVLGFMDTYFTGTNYLITPVVAHVVPSRPFVPNPAEVDAVFEVPVARLLMPGTFGRLSVTRNGRRQQTWTIDHEGHQIWGITANLTRRFHDIALGAAAAT